MRSLKESEVNDEDIYLYREGNVPYKSLKQERYMNWAAKQGKVKQSIVDEFNKASKGIKLPVRAKKKK